MQDDEGVDGSVRSVASPPTVAGRLPRLLAPLGVFLLLAGAARPVQATNICNETVAANRMVDGIPAYAQCAATTGAIYSNNGVDTATASSGTGWVRTQGSGGYQCTELAHRYLYFKWNVQSVPNGNAGTWCDGTIPTGLVKSTTPVHGDLIVFAPGSCGADATTGHVAVIDVVNASSTVTFVEQNSPGRRSCANSTAACFLHATANDGSGLDGGILDAAVAPEGGPPAGTDATTRNDVAPDLARADTMSTGGAIGAGGAIGTGGAIGSGGAVASGGATGSGGAIATGGVAASGGTSEPGSTSLTGVGGSAGATSAASSTPAASSSNGCSCRLGHGTSSGWDAIVLLMLAGIIVTARRRVFRRRSGTPPKNR